MRAVSFLFFSVVGSFGCNESALPAASDDLAVVVRPDDAFVPRDLAEAAMPDLVAVGPTVGWCAPAKGFFNQVFLSPPPLTSKIAPSNPPTFGVDARPGVQQSDVEASISIASAAGARVPGTFSWSQGSGFCLLTFLPAQPLDGNADYYVTVKPQGDFHPAWALAEWVKPTANNEYRGVFTTGSHLRVASVYVVSKRPPTLTYIQVEFSEPVGFQSVRAALRVVRSGAELQGTVVVPSADWPLQAPVPYLQWNFDTPVDGSLPLTISLTGLKTPEGQPLDTTDFKSPTNVNGTFSVTLTIPPGASDYYWRPEF